MATRSFAWFVCLGLGLSGWALAADADKSPEKGPGPAQAAWPNWRGPTHDGISTEKGWLTTWPQEGLKQLWKVELGAGHSSVAVLAGKVYSMGWTANQDTIFCLDASSGETVWKRSYLAARADYGSGPRATPAVDGKAVYTLSADGQALCLDALSGQVFWKRNLQKELNLVLPMHGFSSSPVLEGELLLLNLGTSGAALDKKTGKAVWKSDGDSSYSSPVPCSLGGRRCVALFATTQLIVVDMANGQKIAACEWKTRDNCNCADPVLAGDAIFVTSGYGVGCALIGVSGGHAALAWKNKLNCHYANPVLVGDCLYALLSTGWLKADLACMSVKDGSLKWKQQDVGSGGLMVADGKLLVLSRGGDLILADASPAAYTELARTKTSLEGPCWNSPVLCDGRIYARNEKGALVCLDVRGK